MFSKNNELPMSWELTIHYGLDELFKPDPEANKKSTKKNPVSKLKKFQNLGKNARDMGKVKRVTKGVKRGANECNYDEKRRKFDNTGRLKKKNILQIKENSEIRSMNNKE